MCARWPGSTSLRCFRDDQRGSRALPVKPPSGHGGLPAHAGLTVGHKHVCGSISKYHPSCRVARSSTAELQTAHVQGRRQLSKDDIAQTFHLPIERAARSLGVGLTVLKRQCREFGISRWPFRKMKSLERMLSIVEVSTLAVCLLAMA